MAATITQVKPRFKNDYTISVSTVNLGTYSTGGVSLPISELGLSKVYDVIIKLQSSPAFTPTSACKFYYNPDTQKIMSFISTNAEVADGSDLSNATLRLTAFGA